MRVARAFNIEDLRRLAARRLPKAVREYLDGGAEEWVTLRANREVLDSIRFAPRTLVDVSRRSQKTTLFERTYDSPFGIAPVGAAGLLWHEGEIAAARAARAANVPFVLSTHSFVPLARLARELDGTFWFQLYMPRERETAQRLVKGALDAGCEALVLTTDVPVGGNREHNERNGFAMPPRLHPRTVLDALLHPRWLASVLAPAWLAPSRPLRQPEWTTRRDHMSWSDLAWLRQAWPRRLLVKGVLSPDDAQLALEHGVDGIFVSNHGGRQLDGAPSPMDVLPHIAAVVGGRLAVLVDGGFRRGSDIVKALALGADMVFLGRAPMYGLAAGGEAGVRRALELLRSEVDRVLALLGCTSLDELGPHFLGLPLRGPAPVQPQTPRLRAVG